MFIFEAERLHGIITISKSCLRSDCEGLSVVNAVSLSRRCAFDQARYLIGNNCWRKYIPNLYILVVNWLLPWLRVICPVDPTWLSQTKLLLFRIVTIWSSSLLALSLQSSDIAHGNALFTPNGQWSLPTLLLAFIGTQYDGQPRNQ